MIRNVDEAEFDFDRDTGFEADGPGRYRAEITDRWNIGIAPNGGYLVSVALPALRHSVSKPDPVAVSALFPSRAEPGPAQIEVDVLRQGGHDSAVARMTQGDQTRVFVTATFGDLAAPSGPTAVLEPTPEFPPPEECVRAEGGP